MKTFQFLFVALLILISTVIKAQTTITGCVIYEHGSGVARVSAPIYTQATGTVSTCNTFSATVYTDQTSDKPLNAYCPTPIFPNASTDAAGGGSPNYRNCITPDRGCGIIRTVTLTDCPLDDYVLVLMVIIEVISIYMIRLKNNTGSECMLVA